LYYYSRDVIACAIATFYVIGYFPTANNSHHSKSTPHCSQWRGSVDKSPSTPIKLKTLPNLGLTGSVTSSLPLGRASSSVGYRV
jgi:hypothetical protein